MSNFKTRIKFQVKVVITGHRGRGVEVKSGIVWHRSGTIQDVCISKNIRLALTPTSCHPQVTLLL